MIATASYRPLPPAPSPKKGGGEAWLLDFERFAAGCVRIYDKDQHLVKLRLTDIQRRFVRERTARTIVLKARQVRISTVCLAQAFHQAVTQRGTRAVTVAQDAESTKKLFSRVRVIHREMPVPVPINKNNARELELTNLDSSYYIGTAGAKRFGRSDTLHAVHLTEFAFWPNYDAYTGLMQGISPSGWAVIESTPNGFGQFYQMVKAAKAGQGPFKFLFFPWFVDGTYRSQKTEVSRQEWTEDERLCAAKALLHGVVLDGRQVAWRRDKWAELTDESGVSKFPQEYPEDEQTCFLSSGRPRFNVGHLNAVIPQAEKQKPLRTQLLEGTGLSLKTWAEPQAGGFYIVGADSAEGVSAGDNSSACVMDWHTQRKMADVWGKADPAQFGAELVKVCKVYNNAVLAVETNGIGAATAQAVRGYSNLFYQVNDAGKVSDSPGWDTNSNTRPVMVDTLAQFYKSCTAEQVPDADEIGEAMSFVIGARGRAEAATGAHDDKVMARGITLMVRAQVGPPMVGERKKARTWSGGQI